MRNAIKTMLWAALLILAGSWFWYNTVGNPLSEFALIRHGQTVDGFIIDTWEEAEPRDAGGTVWSNGATYRYRLPDGREFTGGTRGVTRLKDEFRDLDQPASIEVEYLPEKPAVSRIKGDGCQNVVEWLWRKVGLGILLLFVCLAPGAAMLREAFREGRTARANRMVCVIAKK